MRDRSLDQGNGNRLLAAFPADVLARLAPQLEPVTLRRRSILIEPGATPNHVYFPDRGIVSLVMLANDGRVAEVGVIGVEGMVGVPAIFGMHGSPYEAIAQMGGEGRRLETRVLHSELDRVPTFKDLMLRYMHYRLTQVAQTAACNRLHTLTARCCRWLLTAHDSVHQQSFLLTQEFLSLMMGVNRPTLSRTVAGLQRQGIISYRYGLITINDRRALEQGSCECYEKLRQEADLVYRSTQVYEGSRRVQAQPTN